MWEKNPPYGDILIQERKEYVNKKGKTKKGWQVTAIDPNLPRLVIEVVDRAVARMTSVITGSD